jgi:pectinesterase inhibitor-like protein
MRAPLLSSLLVLAVVATVPLLVPAVCISRHDKSESKADEEAAATTVAADEHGSVKTMSLDAYGPLEMAAKKPKEQVLNAQATPATTAGADTYDQKPVGEKQAETATASAADEQPDKYVEALVPDEKAEEFPDKYVEALVPDDKAEVKKKKVKKEKKDESDDSDVATSSKKEKSDDSEVSTSYKKKKKKSDDSDEDASLDKKEKKAKSAASGKKEKDKSDNTSSKKEKEERSADSDASAYFDKEEQKSGDSDAATSVEKQKKQKKEKSGDYFDKEKEENPEEDAAPVDVSADGVYVPPKEEKSGEDATPVDVSTTTGKYVSSSSKANGKPTGGQPAESSTTATATADAYASPKQKVVSSQPMASAAPDELPLAAKSSTTSDAYASPRQQQVASSQPMSGGAPDELPPVAKTSATPEPYASLNVAGGGQPNEPAAGRPPKLSMETFSGMIKRPFAKFLSPVIKSVCAKTEYPEDCESSIGGLPGAASAAATDSVGVLKLAMEAVRQKAIEAMNAATDRMNAPGTDPTTKEALDSCTSSYSDIKTSLETVDDALKRGDVDTAHTNLDSVETDITTCDDGFQERGTPSVMTDHDQELQKLASNLLSIGAAIHH